MLNFNNLKIRNKLRVLSIISILSLLVLGFVSNYFYNTSKVLGLIINAERVHNNTFQEGVEDFFKHQITGDNALIDSSVFKMNAANQMAYNFGTIDQLMQLAENEYIDVLYNNYKLAYNFDKGNAYLMASRIKLFLLLKKDKLAEAQVVAMKGYQLGEKIKNEIQNYAKDSSEVNMVALDKDLAQIRIFYQNFATAISSLNSFANNLLFIGISLIVLLLIITIAYISLIISRSIALPVQEMVEKFGIIAKGNLAVELSIQADSEIGLLADSFRQIQLGLREVIDYTKNVADGDYSTPIVPRSDKDELSIALNKMVVKLKKSSDNAERESWFKSGINSINERLRGDQNLDDIGTHSLSFMMQFLHAQLGSIHLYNYEYQFLKLIGSSGFDPKKLKEKIKLNDGIIGQAASEKRMIILNNIQDQTYNTYSSSGEFLPAQVIVTPLIFNDTLIGILELSSIQTFNETEIQFLEQAAEIIAIKLSSAENILNTNKLLQKTQDQASELQVQQEELRVANEELVEHTKVLTENEKRLQVQQEELRVANEELEERTRQLEIQKDDIGRKNSELTEITEKLEVKARELQLSSQYKSEFLANMSHELRTPLNSLLILSNLLANNKKGNLSEDQIQSARIIHKSGTDLLHLINEVLDLSKIEAGKMSLEILEVATNELKDEIVMNFKATAEDKKLDLNVRINELFPNKMLTDRHRLMQIIRNLISNAFKFTSSGGVSVDFTPTPRSVVFRREGLDYTNTCCIKVSDTGVGIPEEKLEAIFEAFQQADGSISRKYGGTGLGLSISKELVRMLGGEIQLESKVNQGSTFIIYLPTKAISESVKNPESPKESDESVKIEQDKFRTSEPLQKTIPIPFIEDDRNISYQGSVVLIIHHSKPEAQKYMQQTRAKNYLAIVASNIQDGIILAEEYHPKAIMLAMELANLKNENYLKLKSHELIGKLPVHLITPIDYEGPREQEGLKILGAEEFADALNSLEADFISQSKRILVVEDDAVTRKVITQLLSPLDLEIQTVKLAEDAYEILNKEVFDCVILDLGLPDYSGKELLEKLKLNQIPIPKVIVYTGKEMSKEEIKSLNNYTSTIILKGLKSDERLMDEITLFLHQVTKSKPEVKAKPSSPDDDILFKGKRILVVDDEIRNVFALGKILEEKDIEVLEAENGQVAVEVLLADKKIDLVLMDVMMPVMDGYEAMRIIRTNPEIKDIPIICLTAKAMKEDHDNALKNGANDYLSKPLNEEKLFSMLKIWLYKK